MAELKQQDIQRWPLAAIHKLTMGMRTVLAGHLKTLNNGDIA